MCDVYVTEAPLKEEKIPCIEPIAALILANLIIAVYEALICTIKTDAALIGLILKLSGGQFRETQDVLSSLCIIGFRRFKVSPRTP